MLWCACIHQSFQTVGGRTESDCHPTTPQKRTRSFFRLGKCTVWMTKTQARELWTLQENDSIGARVVALYCTVLYCTVPRFQIEDAYVKERSSLVYHHNYDTTYPGVRHSNFHPSLSASSRLVADYSYHIFSPVSVSSIISWVRPKIHERRTPNSTNLTNLVLIWLLHLPLAGFRSRGGVAW